MLESARYCCDAASDCREGWIAVETSPRSPRKAFQEFLRGDAFYRRPRRNPGSLQGNWASDNEGLARARHADDDQREVSKDISPSK